MNEKELIEKLRKEYDSNEVAAAVFLLFAMRKRPRSDQTVHGIAQAMKTAGFNYPRHKYEEFLRFLVNLGIGRLIINSKGQVEGIDNIKRNLIDIGKAATGKTESEIKDFKSRNVFKSLPLPPIKPAPKVSTIPLDRIVADSVGLTVYINGRPWHLRIPDEAPTEEITRLIETFRRKKSG